MSILIPITITFLALGPIWWYWGYQAGFSDGKRACKRKYECFKREDDSNMGG